MHHQAVAALALFAIPPSLIQTQTRPSPDLKGLLQLLRVGCAAHLQVTSSETRHAGPRWKVAATMQWHTHRRCGQAHRHRDVGQAAARW